MRRFGHNKEDPNVFSPMANSRWKKQRALPKNIFKKCVVWKNAMKSFRTNIFEVVEFESLLYYNSRWKTTFALYNRTHCVGTACPFWSLKILGYNLHWLDTLDSVSVRHGHHSRLTPRRLLLVNVRYYCRCQNEHKNLRGYACMAYDHYVMHKDSAGKCNKHRDCVCIYARCQRQ